MSTYIAPIRDMQFVLNEIAGLEEICALPGNEECSVELVESILDEASKFVSLDQLCLSPQCGFASTHEGNKLSEDEERRKLELVVETAAEVWG